MVVGRRIAQVGCAIRRRHVGAAIGRLAKVRTGNEWVGCR